MKKSTVEVLSYGIYMANMWSKDEAIKIWGKMLGEHIFEKWAGYAQNNIYEASMRLIYELDSECLDKLMDHVLMNYWGRTNINNDGKYYKVVVKNLVSAETEHWIFKKDANSGKHITDNYYSSLFDKDAPFFAEKGYVCEDDNIVSISSATSEEIAFLENLHKDYLAIKNNKRCL